MNERDRQQIKRFITDPVMSMAVYESLYRFFLKRRKTDDVQILAAERLALFMLEDAWKEIERCGIRDGEIKEQSNVGL